MFRSSGMPHSNGCLPRARMGSLPGNWRDHNPLVLFSDFHLFHTHQHLLWDGKATPGYFRRLAIKNRPRLGDRLGFKNRVGLDVTDKYFSPAALALQGLPSSHPILLLNIPPWRRAEGR